MRAYYSDFAHKGPDTVPYIFGGNLIRKDFGSKVDSFRLTQLYLSTFQQMGDDAAEGIGDKQHHILEKFSPLKLLEAWRSLTL